MPRKTRNLVTETKIVPIYQRVVPIMATELPIKGGGAAEFNLQLMSDLHLETPRFLPIYESFTIQSRAPYLALLGDIGLVHDDRLFAFIDAQLQQFKVVFYVLGNHEPYELDELQNQQYQDAVTKMEDWQTLLTRTSTLQRGKFVFLNRTRYDIDDRITILGCTLFSRISERQQSTISMFVSDFSHIPGWTAEQHNIAHDRDVVWLNAQVEGITETEPKRQVIILTHYSPTMASEANDEEHLEDPRNVLSAFVTDLSQEVCWKSPIVKVWAFGHTHHNCDYVDVKSGKRVVSNQRGYGREDIFDFDSDKVVIV